MEVRLTVAAPPEALYRLCLESFQVDYQMATGCVLALSAIQEKLSYVKRFGKKAEQSVRITLQRLVPNQCYTVAVESNRGVQLLSYQFYPLENSRVEMIYTEEYLPEGRWNQLNYKLLLPLMKKMLEKKMLLQMKKFVECAMTQEVS